MALRIMADNNQTINCYQDAALYNILCNDKNFIFGGIGDEMGISYSANSLTITINDGGCVICGRHVYSTGNNNITLTPNSGTRVLLRYDMTNPDFCSLVTLTVPSPTKHENINDKGIYSDLPLFVIYTNANGVDDVYDLRTIKHTNSAWLPVYDGVIKGGQSVDVDLKNFTRLKVYAVLGDTNGIFEIDLETQLNTWTVGSYAYASSCTKTRYMNSRYQNYTCFAGVNEEKTKFYNVEMGLFYGTTNTRKNNADDYYIYKIEGLE